MGPGWTRPDGGLSKSFESVNEERAGAAGLEDFGEIDVFLMMTCPSQVFLEVAGQAPQRFSRKRERTLALC